MPEIGDLPEDPDDRDNDAFATWLETIAAATTEEEMFERLVGQRPPTSKLARQHIRGRLITLLNEKVKEFGSGLAAARTADAWLQEGGGDLDDLQGEGFVTDEVDPWENSVIGADVLDEVKTLLHAYVHATEEQRDAIALWIAYAHVFDCFGLSPILDLSSATKRCGKTSTVVVLRHLSRAPLLSGNITPAALFRAVQAWKPTLLIDEADTFAKMSDELRGILNAGHTRDTAYVVRAEGDANEPRLFSTWAPKVVAAIGRLPDTIEDRAIRVVLTRKPTHIVKRDAFDPESVREDCGAIRRRLARFALDDLDAIARARVERPDGLNDRAWNNWRPLFAVAAIAGRDWPARAERAALALSGDESDQEEDVGLLALRHVWEVVQPADQVATADILHHLIGKDDAPFAKWWESSVARDELKGPAAKLASLLKPFRVKPKQLWIDGTKVRGYSRDDFPPDIVAAYLERDSRDGEDGRSRSSTDAGSTDLTVSTDLQEGGREGVAQVEVSLLDEFRAEDDGTSPTREER